MLAALFYHSLATEAGWLFVLSATFAGGGFGLFCMLAMFASMDHKPHLWPWAWFWLVVCILAILVQWA